VFTHGRSELGDGEFVRGLHELLRSGFFKPPPISAPKAARPALKHAAPIA
jgi:hypothetical protein